MDCTPFGEQGLSAHSWGALGYWGFGFLCFPHWAAVRAHIGLGEADGRPTWAF